MVLIYLLETKNGPRVKSLLQLKPMNKTPHTKSFLSEEWLLTAPGADENLRDGFLYYSGYLRSQIKTLTLLIIKENLKAKTPVLHNKVSNESKNIYPDLILKHPFSEKELLDPKTYHLMELWSSLLLPHQILSMEAKLNTNKTIETALTYVKEHSLALSRG